MCVCVCACVRACVRACVCVKCNFNPKIILFQNGCTKNKI